MSVVTMPPSAITPVAMTTALPSVMSINEFNALPDDPSKDRVLIRGQLREKPMTKRNRWHSDAESMISHLLINWLERTDPTFGRVMSGEVGCELPVLESSVGIDVAFRFVIGPNIPSFAFYPRVQYTF